VRKILLLFFVSLFFFILHSRLISSNYLTFSDPAKLADIARNITSFREYVTNFTFFDPQLFEKGGPVFASWVPPLMPLSIAISFTTLGISDFSVQITSGVFYLLLVISVFLLGKKIYGETAGFFAALAVAANPNFLDYATSGASETLFAFEIVLAAYLFILGKKRANVFGFLVLILMYFTRPQAIIYLFGFLLLFFLLNLPIKKALSYFSVAFVLGSAIYLLFSKQGLFAVTQHLPGVAPSDALRGGTLEAGILPISKKIFYNLYNFYRLLPQIMSPYLWALFIIGLFKWGKDRVENSFKLATVFTVTVTFLVTALTIPFFRYLHPVVPLVYILGVATLVWIISKFARGRFVSLISATLIFIFVVGQTLGVIFLDSRFKAKTVNKEKPPVYVVLSRILKENTDPENVIVTNLDTWGSWYGERRTVWYPLKPEQLDLKDTENPFDVIFLTNYLMDDENYYMNEGWRQIFENPKSPKDEFIAKNYKFAGEFKVPPDETYEKQEGRAILLVRK